MNNEKKAHFSELYDTYADMLYRIGLLYLKHREDAEEAVSDTFVKLMKSERVFEDFRHEKAWLAKVMVNRCKDMRKTGWFSKVIYNEDILQYMTTPEHISLVEEIMALPPKYRVVIYMHYYEGYTTAEIGRILGITESAVCSRLFRGRSKLKCLLTEGGYFHV